MTRIQTNVPSLLAQRVLAEQNRGLTSSLERLSTGLRINRGADDPAGLIASENLRAEKAAINSAIGNAQRAEQVINVAEGGLQEINSLLVELQGLVGQSANDAGVSPEEKEANQLQIDSILQTIDRIANSTSFQGTKLLNGNFDYTVTNQSSVIADINVNAARLANNASATLAVTVDVLTSAQTATTFVSTGTAINNGGQSVTIEITGNEGVQQFTFASTTSQADVVNAINTFSDALGVSAAIDATNSDRIRIDSQEFGTSQFSRVKVLNAANSDIVFASATAATGASDLKDLGADATVIINGVQATTDGLTARVATDGFDVEVTIDGTGVLNNVGQDSTFTITGGGADFNLSPAVNLAGKVSLGVETVTTGNLGNSTDGFLSELKSGGTGNVINGDLTKAQSIVDAAVKQTSTLRGRLGAFQKNVIGATISNLGVTLENTTAAESAIRDTDFATETATLTRQQIITQAAQQSLAIANQQPQAVLQLLG